MCPRVAWSSDLKTENVLLSGGFTHAAAGWPVLADFGLANWLKNDGSRLQTFCGTPEFIAPEVCACSSVRLRVRAP